MINILAASTETSSATAKWTTTTRAATKATTTRTSSTERDQTITEYDQFAHSASAVSNVGSRNSSEIHARRSSATHHFGSIARECRNFRYKSVWGWANSCKPSKTRHSTAMGFAIANNYWFESCKISMVALKLSLHKCLNVRRKRKTHTQTEAIHSIDWFRITVSYMDHNIIFCHKLHYFENEYWIKYENSSCIFDAKSFNSIKFYYPEAHLTFIFLRYVWFEPLMNFPHSHLSHT